MWDIFKMETEEISSKYYKKKKYFSDFRTKNCDWSCKSVLSTNEVHNQNEKENEAIQGKEGCNGKLTKLVIKFNYGKLSKIVTKFNYGKLTKIVTKFTYGKLLKNSYKIHYRLDLCAIHVIFETWWSVQIGAELGKFVFF